MFASCFLIELDPTEDKLLEKDVEVTAADAVVDSHPSTAFGRDRFVDLDGLFVATQLLAVEIDHGTAQFVQEEPRSLVGDDPRLAWN